MARSGAGEPTEEPTAKRLAEARRRGDVAVSRDFGNGEAAARAHLLHLHLYVSGATVPPGFLATEDPRWDAAVAAGFGGVATTLTDLTNRWAIDSEYAEKIAGRIVPGRLRSLASEPASVRPARVLTTFCSSPCGRLRSCPSTRA